MADVKVIERNECTIDYSDKSTLKMSLAHLNSTIGKLEKDLQVISDQLSKAVGDGKREKNPEWFAKAKHAHKKKTELLRELNKLAVDANSALIRVIDSECPSDSVGYKVYKGFFDAAKEELEEIVFEKLLEIAVSGERKNE